MMVHTRSYECPYCEHIDYPVRGQDRLGRKSWICPNCRGALDVPPPRPRRQPLRQPEEATW